MANNSNVPAGPVQRQQAWYDFTVYEVDFNTAGGNNIAAGASASSSFQIQADSNFIWEKATYLADITHAAFLQSTQPVPLISCQIVDSGSGRQLFSAAVPVPSIFGTGQLPFILPVRRKFMANSLVTVTLNNYDAAQAYNIRLSFIGSKEFIGGAPPGFV